MATYNAISVSEKQSGAPLTSNLIDKLDQNPLAIFEGNSTIKVSNDAIAANSISGSRLWWSDVTVQSNLNSATGSVRYLYTDSPYQVWYRFDIAYSVAGTSSNPSIVNLPVSVKKTEHHIEYYDISDDRGAIYLELDGTTATIRNVVHVGSETFRHPTGGVLSIVVPCVRS